MRYMIKPIISNILLLMESLLLFLITITIISKITILNPRQTIKILDKSNYYEYIYDETKNTMIYTTKKSEYKSKIIDNTFTEEDIKNDINQFVRDFYKGKKTTLNTERLKEILNKNIENYQTININNEIEKQDIEQKRQEEYINKMISTYKNEIRLMNSLTDSSVRINKYNKISNILLPIFLIDLIVLTLINKKIFNKKEYNILFFTSTISLLGTIIYMNFLNIKEVFIYNDKVSEIIKQIINNVQIKSLIFVLIYMVIGILLTKKTKKETE